MIRAGCDMPKVHAEAVVPLPISADRAWHHLKDFHAFATTDVFHQRVTVHAEAPRQGAGLTIEHRWLGVRLWRVGRILCWRPPWGYAFSDLSRRGAWRGFPHVFAYALRPRGADQCQLIITVRGRWTATWLPRWAVRLWLKWVMLKIKHTTAGRLLRREWRLRRRPAAH
jgi:hypothetical protein